jgi:hypothetical protein
MDDVFHFEEAGWSTLKKADAFRKLGFIGEGLFKDY